MGERKQTAESGGTGRQVWGRTGGSDGFHFLVQVCYTESGNTSVEKRTFLDNKIKLQPANGLKGVCGIPPALQEKHQRTQEPGERRAFDKTRPQRRDPVLRMDRTATF